MRPMEESERKAKLDAQLGAMAAAPVKRRRRVVKPLSTTPTPVPAAVQFTDDATTPSTFHKQCDGKGQLAR